MRKFESLFDGTLDTWKTPPVDLDSKDDATPVCFCPYPVPWVHKAMFINKVKRLVKLVVLEEANEPEWKTLSFAQSRVKTN